MAPTITLYSFPPSQNAIRPELALLEKGLAFDKVHVDLLKGDHQKPVSGRFDMIRILGHSENAACFPYSPCLRLDSLERLE